MRLDLTHPGRRYRLHATRKRDMEALPLPFPRDWTPDNFNLPPDWKEIALRKLDEMRRKYRGLQLFLDICVGCGACADKCPFFSGTEDPYNMPVARQDLLRGVYRRYFTTAGRILKDLAGGRELTEDLIRDWYVYYYQCSQCRRCAVFCPFGIDTAVFTMAAREILAAIGLTPRSLTESIAKCEVSGNHMGISPSAMLNTIRFMEDEIKEESEIEVHVPINKKGSEILFVTPSADFFGEPHWHTFKGYLKLFHQIGLDYTLSTYASEGGNFGTWLNYEHMKKINRKIVQEAQRLGVKWILGGECGHMWRVLHAYMGTMNVERDFLEEPVSPITGTHFANADHSKAVHICEFTADLILHNKVRFDSSRNKQFTVTFSDSCNPARFMGLLEEPRYILQQVCKRYVELNPEVNRERTICCLGGGGLLADETLELRLRAIKPKVDAIRETGANFLALICAIDKAVYPEYLKHYGLQTQVGGVHELVGNALVMT